ncbi:MAG: hypothetical protein AAGF26_14315 [Cyanobacteria bacterium P01_G01_bin.49]
MLKLLQTELIIDSRLVNSHDYGRGISSVGFNVPDSWLEFWLLRLGILPEIYPYLVAQIEGINLLKSGVTTVAHNHNPRNWNNLYTEIMQQLKSHIYHFYRQL